jgi:tRNA A22 N-methylase
MGLWEKIRKDVQKSVMEGITTLREKAEELTEEGKKKYKLLELKNKVHKEMAELGGKVYGLSSKVKNPMLDAKVKSIIERIKKLEAQIKKLEAKPKKAVKKTVRKITRRKKK